MYIGSRRELMWTLRDRAERAEAEQELRVAQARGNERARIAREMHDVLAHRISQISMHAGALASATTSTADEMRDSADGDPGQGATRRSPTCAACSACCATTRPASRLDAPAADVRRPRRRWSTRRARPALHVEFDDRRRRRRRRCPTRSGRTPTGSCRRASPTPASTPPARGAAIEVSGSPDDGLDVVLRNPLGFGADAARPGAGLGLVGLAERAELRGGRLEHGAATGRAFVLHGVDTVGRVSARRSACWSSTTTRWSARRWR